jgi:hypothetical protein
MGRIWFRHLGEASGRHLGAPTKCVYWGCILYRQCMTNAPDKKPNCGTTSQTVHAPSTDDRDALAGSDPSPHTLTFTAPKITCGCIGDFMMCMTDATNEKRKKHGTRSQPVHMPSTRRDVHSCWNQSIFTYIHLPRPEIYYMCGRYIFYALFTSCSCF